jgi:hypothetical protein
LVCEHLAHRVLEDAGHSAAHSELITSDAQYFLEVRRFDRTSSGGRRGVITLASFDHELSGIGGTWSDIAQHLARRAIIDLPTLREIRFRDLFGALIANDDRHAANISFFVNGTHITGLTPTYDMLPMLYRPISGDLPPRTFTPPRPEPRLGDLWQPACSAATEFWRRVCADQRISMGFRELSKANCAEVEHIAQAGRFLPV